MQTQKRTLDEIKRRLDIFSKQWQEGRLSLPVQTEMTKLTTGMFLFFLLISGEATDGLM